MKLLRVPVGYDVLSCGIESFVLCRSFRSLGGDYLPTMAHSKSMLKMRRTLMDSYNETVRSAPKASSAQASKGETSLGCAQS